MLPRLRTLLLAAPLAALFAAHPAASAPCASSAAQDAGSGRLGRSLVQAEGWSELLERDARLSFTSTLRGRALAALGKSGLAPSERASALFALGAGRIVGSRSLLHAAALEGVVEERRAAILGLGDFGAGESSFLLELLERETGPLAAAAVLALHRSGDGRGRERIRRLADRKAGDEAGDLADLAAELAGLAANELPSTPIEGVREYLELRWKAARHYGLIDGRSWNAWLLEDLGSSDEFLDAIVFRGAARLARIGVADHYLAALLEDDGPERVRGAVAHMPSALAQIVSAGVWEPADHSEWSAIILEVERQGLERKAIDLLRTIRLVPGLSNYSAVLLVRGGSSEGLPLVELDLLSPDPARRALVVRTLGDSGLKHYSSTLEPMLGDGDARVRAEALVALVRLGHDESVRELHRHLSDSQSEEFEPLIGALCSSAQHPLVLADLSGLLPRLIGRDDLRLAVAIALADQGRIGPPRWIVRDALAAGDLRVRDRLAMVRVLGNGADQSELEILRGLFPAADDPELNVELGLAMLRNLDPGMLPLLRIALWQGPRSRSLLAAALIAEIDGIDSLRTELSKPPAASTRTDLRRVGFALGQWGGLEEVERLSRRSSASDPALQGALLGALAGRTF